MEEVELGVQRVAEEELDHDLARPELAGEPAKPALVGVGRRAEQSCSRKSSATSVRSRAAVGLSTSCAGRIESARAARPEGRCIPTSRRQQLSS